MNIGIRGLGTYIPDQVMTAGQISKKTGIPEEVIAQKFGIKQKPVPGPKDTPSFMGLEAAKRALENAEVAPGDIDLVIWNGAQHKDYPCWLAGMKVAYELGAEKAWSFDMEAMCGSMMAGFDVAKSMMLTKKDLNRVLLVSGYRNVDLIDLEVKETSFMADIGASGAAVVLEKGYDRNVVLESSFRGDGSFAEDCVVPVLGANAWPPKAEDAQKAHFVVRNVESFKKKLGERTMPNFYHVIRDALEKSGGMTDEDIDYLAILHFKRSAHHAVLEELNLAEDQTTYLDDYGHLGQNDQILSMEIGLREGRIHDGDIIVMVGAGLGFVWASSVVRWGPSGD
ncbi:MAG: 3-oxoacyl-ACP synthase [Spirochaetales bacterium]|nr:3-oxoacyl-ACP synthase [Spirochaetales bacterium]MCF7939228.1 3-oxoacyl-ACP synthase [Spirochaetales bacterium]